MTDKEEPTRTIYRGLAFWRGVMWGMIYSFVFSAAVAIIIYAIRKVVIK